MATRSVPKKPFISHFTNLILKRQGDSKTHDDRDHVPLCNPLLEISVRPGPEEAAVHGVCGTTREVGFKLISEGTVSLESSETSIRRIRLRSLLHRKQKQKQKQNRRRTMLNRTQEVLP